MVKNFLYIAGLICALSSCTNVSVENPSDKFLSAKRLAKLENKILEEISGGDASSVNPGHLWVHNDSGNDPELYLLDNKLNILLTCRLDMIENRDWEDIAVGPGPDPGKSYIYIGEIGDNLSQFNSKYIYRLPEPKWDGKTKSLTITDFDTITFQLDEQKDAEALLLDPLTKDIYVVSKREEPVWLYLLKYPQPTKGTIVAQKLMSLPFKQIVAGDFSHDGKMVLLKNYEHIYFWERKDQTSVADVLEEKPFEVPYTIEPQGEAIMWAKDNSGFYTISEMNKGKDSYLYFYEAK
jgi:hypothetical protein